MTESPSVCPCCGGSVCPVCGKTLNVTRQDKIDEVNGKEYCDGTFVRYSCSSCSYTFEEWE